MFLSCFIYTNGEFILDDVMGMKSLLAGLLIIVLVAGCVSSGEVEYTDELEELIEEAEEKTKETSEMMKQDFFLESVYCDTGNDDGCGTEDEVSFVLRNIGLTTIEGSKTKIYINDVEQDASCPEGIIEESMISECSFNPKQEVSCDSDVIKVSIESGLSKTRLIRC